MDYITEKISLWEYLSTQSKPIVLYGMGEGAVKIAAVCESKNIKIQGIFASDEYVRGHSFLGYKVEKLQEIEKRLADFVVLLAFGVDYDEMLERIFEIAEHFETYAPDVPLFGGELFTLSYCERHRAEFDMAYSLFEDPKSKGIFADMLNYKISGKLGYLRQNMGSRAEDWDILNLGSDESFVDLGAYNGDTVLEFAEHTKTYNSIVALEPNPKNFEKLKKTVTENALENVLCINKGSFSHSTTLKFAKGAGRNCSAVDGGKYVEVEVAPLDELLKNASATYIKADVEGAEEETLLGCAETIRAQKPKISIAAYHRSNDLFLLPLLLHKLNPDYKLHLRRHKYVPAWEIIIYAV